MSLPQLKFDVAEKVILRVHSNHSIGKQTPAEIALWAEEQGLHVIALTDCANVNGIPEMIVAGEKVGIYVVPGVEIRSSAGTYLGYFIDYQDKNLLQFLQKTNQTKPTTRLPTAHEVRQVILKAGGLPVRADKGDGAFNPFEVTGADIFPRLQEKLSDNSLHKNYFNRMLWRSTNLSPEEFVDSLQPQIIRINRVKFGHLVNMTLDDEEIPAGFPGCPFIILRGESLGKEQLIRDILRRFKCPIVAESETELYREIAWQIYKMGHGSETQKKRNLLKFNLDDRLYRKKSGQCLVFFFLNPDNIHLREIKKTLRRELGSMRFYRLEYRDSVDMFFTSFIHIPDEEHIQRESWILQRLGIAVPQVR